MTGKRIGIVIGNNYPNSDKELRFAVADAEKMKEVLVNKDICGFDEVICFLNQTSKEPSLAIEKVFKKANNDLILIYFSGHAIRNFEGKLFLMFEDTTDDALITTSLAFEFIEHLIRYPSRKSVIIILDCTYSGSAHLSVSNTEAILLTSTGPTGSPIAKEEEKLGHGIFTYYLLEGLEKGAADQDGDGLISINDLYNYAYVKTKENSNQHPRMIAHVENTIFLGKNPLIIPSEQTAIRFAFSEFSADIGTTQDKQDLKDLIGIGAEVDAFAYLIAAKKLHPPIAIGLFGDWGSGKSFFMEALRQRIHKITLDAKNSNQKQMDISIYKYIAQIEFNAWNYVEGELWASLVDHIFRNLKTRMEDKLPLLQQRQQAVIDKLKIKERAQQEAQACMDELKIQLDKTKEEVTRLEQEREKALKELNNLKIKDILKEIPIKNYKDDVRILNNLGFKREIKNASELLQGVDELKSMLEQGNALITPLYNSGWSDWKLNASLITMILIGPVICLILIKYFSEIPPIADAIVSMAAFLSGLTIYLKQGTMWLSHARDQVENVRIKLEAERCKEEEENLKDIAELERIYKEKAQEYEEAKNKKEKTDCEIAELEQELQRITPGRLLLDFINQRVCSLDYRKYLGITSLIRSDFEQLSELISKQNEYLDTIDDRTISEKDDHLINRIVLYIDDLDRCPPDKVVQVLQAVHLLLAFPLFVVVLAVDTRWLSQSLQAYYKDLLTFSTKHDSQIFSKDFGRQASPQDYLEKIFQIPFWVRPLPEEARISIVEGLIEKSQVSSLGITAKIRNKQLDNEQTGFGNTGDNNDTEVKEELDMQWEASELKRTLDLGVNTDLKPKSLEIEEIEFQFIKDLRSLLGQTPRSVKRFVNIYRLIKAISLNQEAKFVEGRPNEDFKYVLFLLAVLTGLPSISSEFFRQLRGERLEIEQDQIDQQVIEHTQSTLAQVLDKLHFAVLGCSQTQPCSSVSAGMDSSDTLKNAVTGHTSHREYEDWDACCELDRLEFWLHQYEHGSWLKLDTSVFAKWAPEVVRFSFRREKI